MKTIALIALLIIYITCLGQAVGSTQVRHQISISSSGANGTSSKLDTTTLFRGYMLASSAYTVIGIRYAPIIDKLNDCVYIGIQFEPSYSNESPKQYIKSEDVAEIFLRYAKTRDDYREIVKAHTKGVTFTGSCKTVDVRVVLNSGATDYTFDEFETLVYGEPFLQKNAPLIIALALALLAIIAAAIHNLTLK